MRIVFILAGSIAVSAFGPSSLIYTQRLNRFVLKEVTDQSYNAEKVRFDYKNLIHKLTVAIDDAADTLDELHSLALDLKKVELIDPNVTEASSPPERIKRALAEAKAAADAFGHESKECLHAWDEVEGIIKGVKELDDHHYRYSQKAVIEHPHDYSAIVDLQSIKDFIEAVATIEHTKKLLKLEDQRLYARKKDTLLP